MKGIIMDKKKWSKFFGEVTWVVSSNSSNINIDHFFNESDLPFEPSEEFHFSLPQKDLSIVIDSNNEMHVCNSSLDKFNTMHIDLETITIEFINSLINNVNLPEYAKRFK